MSNRQQRRAAKRKGQGKRPGETFADVLAKQKMIKEAVEKTAHDTSVHIEADIKTQRFLWMSVEALNRAFGFGGERAKRYMLALEEVANEFEALAKKHGKVYAVDNLRRRCEQITGMEVKPVHEEEMRQARLENQAKGIYFPEDDPDDW